MSGWPSCSGLPDRAACRALALGFALLPGAANAHSSAPGIEGFYLGVLHPLTSLAQVLAFLALGLVFGQRWPRNFALGWAVFAAGCVLGIVLGQMGVPMDAAEPVLLALALAAGVLAALWPSGPAIPAIALAGMAGIVIGLVSTPDPGPPRSVAVTLTGSFAGAVALLLNAAAGVGWLRENARAVWVGIGLRVLAAWVAAISALLLALALSGPR
ncbi:MAG: HupE/UreJ family protein [Pseudomonadota bacterium]